MNWNWNWNWLRAQSPRVLRTIEKVVGKVNDALQGAQEIWNRVRVVLTRALDPHPEAQAAVIRAIEEELLPSDG
jgi:hypothetical protein